MKEGRWRWLLPGCLLLLAALLCLWRQGDPPAAEEDARASLARAKLHGEAGGQEADTGKGSTAEKEAVTLPLALVRKMDCEVFDEDSGNLTPAFVELLRLTREERTKVRPVIADHLVAFGEVELANHEVDQKWGYPVLTLRPCEEQSAALGQKLVAALEPVVGPSRAQAAEMLVAHQFRDGGRYWVELSITQRSDGLGYDFNRKIGDRRGSANSQIQTIVPNCNYSRSARWRHLDRIDPEEGK